MKYYVQYLAYGAVNKDKLIEPCGDRAVFILDGRNNLKTWINDAIQANKAMGRHYPHFRIMRGSFSDSRSIYTTVPSENLGIYSGY